RRAVTARQRGAAVAEGVGPRRPVPADGRGLGGEGARARRRANAVGRRRGRAARRVAAADAAQPHPRHAARGV
ncbi:hypothetical protein MNEG_13669, partial [Monoraphidium neglectum]